jgi:hypothetical protein
MMPVSYIHFSLFAANRSWPPAAAHLDFRLVSVKNRTQANDIDHPQTSQPRTHKPLVAGANPVGATVVFGFRKPKVTNSRNRKLRGFRLLRPFVASGI